MRGKRISVIALALTITAFAGETESSNMEPTPAAVTPQKDDFTPMTRSERIGAYVNGTFGPKSVVKSAAHAGFGQIRTSPKEWGGGAAGFGSRMGSSLAQHAVRGTLQHGVAMLLHENNKYQRSSRTGFVRRAKHAIVSSFLTRRDNGRRGFGFSKIGSAGGAAFISRAWMPHAVATAGAGASTFGLTIAADVGINMLREFWPDLKHKLGRK